MTNTNFLDLSAEDTLHLLEEAERLLQAGYPANFYEGAPLLVGMLFHNEGRYEKGVSEAAAGRLGGTVNQFTRPDSFTLSMQEKLDELSLVANATDILLSAQVNEDTFGNGRSVTELMATETPIDFISLHDDIYAHQSALAVLSAVKSRLGKLDRKRIAISWGFGSRFVLPSTAHSILALAPKLGSDVRVVAPPKFSLLHRVYRDASEMAKKHDSTVEQVDTFEEAFPDVDAIFALNWGSFDNFSHPERNASDARGFEDWYFTSDIMPDNSLFVTEPPVRRELLASTNLLLSKANLTREWLARRVAVLVSTIRFILGTDDEDKPMVII